jgi:hypothetical protein
MELLLGIPPLTDEEKRSRRRLVRIVVYSDEALLLVLVLTFSKHWAEIIGSWMVINLALVASYGLYIRKSKREERFTVSPTARIEAIQELSARLPRIMLAGVVSATGFIVVGFFNPLGFVMAGLILASSVFLFIWARKAR